MYTEFFMSMVPPTVTDQMHRIGHRKDGKPYVYDSSELAAAKSKLKGELHKHRPLVPLEGPVRLVVKWCFPVCGKHTDGEYKISKPDTDNLQKALKDCMTKKGFWKDDAQVASEVIEKFWANTPGIYVYAEEIDAQLSELEKWELMS